MVLANLVGNKVDCLFNTEFQLCDNVRAAKKKMVAHLRDPFYKNDLEIFDASHFFGSKISCLLSCKALIGI